MCIAFEKKPWGICTPEFLRGLLITRKKQCVPLKLPTENVRRSVIPVFFYALPHKPRKKTKSETNILHFSRGIEKAHPDETLDFFDTNRKKTRYR